MLFRSKLPTVEEIEAHREQHLLEQVTTWLDQGHAGSERRLLATLVDEFITVYLEQNPKL